MTEKTPQRVEKFGIWACVHCGCERNKGRNGQSHRLDEHVEVNYENPQMPQSYSGL